MKALNIMFDSILIIFMTMLTWYMFFHHEPQQHGFTVPYSAQQLPWQPCGRMLLSNPPRCGDDTSDDPGLVPLAK